MFLIQYKDRAEAELGEVRMGSPWSEGARPDHRSVFRPRVGRGSEVSISFGKNCTRANLGKIHPDTLDQGSANIAVKGQVVTILGFAGRVASVTATEHCPCDAKVA